MKWTIYNTKKPDINVEISTSFKTKQKKKKFKKKIEFVYVSEIIIRVQFIVELIFLKYFLLNGKTIECFFLYIISNKYHGAVGVSDGIINYLTFIIVYRTYINNVI